MESATERRPKTISQNYEMAARSWSPAVGDPDSLYDRDEHNNRGLAPMCRALVAVSSALKSPKRDRALNEMQGCEARGKTSQTVDINRSSCVHYFMTGIYRFRAKRPSRLFGRWGRPWLELEGYEPMIADIEVTKRVSIRLL